MDDAAEMTVLRTAAIAIWRAGVNSVLGNRCIQRLVRCDDDQLWLGSHSIVLPDTDRLIVVGAGKAVGAMAIGLEQALGYDLLARMHASGWLNVPEGISQTPQFVHLHAARPMGVNEPTDAAVKGTERILELVAGATGRDVCVCMISGGASALLVRPAEGITLDDKIHVTRWLSAAGASIQDLNIVRTALSTVKGGGLARVCRAGRLITFILSDVLGDPLEIIGSGPTIPMSPTYERAWKILYRFAGERRFLSIMDWLLARHAALSTESNTGNAIDSRIEHLIIGNLDMAIAASQQEAKFHGWETHRLPVRVDNPTAEEEGQHLAQALFATADKSSSFCLIGGGEPVVRLGDTEQPGHGGRNQQLVLAAAEWLRQKDPPSLQGRPWLILSAGTDGEDGPTNAAGAFCDSTSADRWQAMELDPADALRRHDAYSFFQQLGDLFVTGATGTNVCDLRIALCGDAGGR